MNRLTVAQLKQLVDRPDVVEMHDVTAQDPRLLIHLKVYVYVCVCVHACVRACVCHIARIFKRILYTMCSVYNVS